MAAAIAALYPGAARAVLFYGSCLRERELDGLMLDFYLIVSDYREAYGRGWFAFANTLVPPNVFPFEHDGLAAKYAVLSEADFARLNGPEAGDVSVWARFAQPSRLVWAADEAARDRAVEAVARAAPTLLGFALPMGGRRRPARRRGGGGFELTYASELQGRAARAVRLDRRHRSRALPALRRGGAAAGAGRRADAGAARGAGSGGEGKVLTLVRLAKATTTYAGGVDYLAWKINRHAGTKIEVKPWQRRWPILGALTLLPRLLKRGAIR